MEFRLFLPYILPKKQPFEGAEVAKPTGQASPFDFTAAQRAAIEHGAGRGLVIAGPGAGKTAVLRERIFNLVQRQGVDAQRILTLAFNKAAEKELFERAKDIGKVEVRTVHGFARRIINENLERLGLQYRPQVPKETEFLVPFIRNLMKEDSKTGRIDQRKLNKIVSEIDVARANVREGLFDPSTLSPEAKRFAIAYETFKAQRRLMDFDDMLIYAADLIEKYPDIREGIQEKYDFFQIDEAQDISQTDYRLIRQFGENVFMVGDDDQSIYGFRGGSGEIMQQFAESGTQYPVTENFRSTPEIVELGSRLMEGSYAPRLAKDLTSTRESGPAPRFVESTPSTLIENLEKELIEGRENVVLVRTRAERGLLWNALPKHLQERVSGIRTMHSVKGLEFDRVIVLLNTLARQGSLYRSFPSVADADDLDAAIEEERRLLYVAMTRAENDLVVMGKESKFLPELGMTGADAHSADNLTNDELENVSQRQLEPSRRIEHGMRGMFHRFRARYQRVRAYHDLVEMERRGQIPNIEVIENLSAAQVHREKIEELGKQLGLQPTDRTRRPRRLGLLDRLLTLPARPGTVTGFGYAGVIPASVLGVTQGLDPVSVTGLNIAPLAISKGLRHLDNWLYPFARRVSQDFDTYKPLHHPLPEAVRAALPEGVDPADFNIIESNIDNILRSTHYEFPHPEQGWEGDMRGRPLYDVQGQRMNRVTEARANELNQLGQLTDLDTFLDTTETSANVRVTPYEPFGGDPYYRYRRPRSPRELSMVAMEHLEEMRGHLEASRTSARRPRGFSPRLLDFRFDWNRQHRRLIRPVDRFLTANRGQGVVDLRGLERLLNRLNREYTRVGMGSQYGSHDIGGRNIRLHNEVMDLLEDVWNPDSPYYNNPRQFFARGRLHELPDGSSVGTGDPDDIDRPPQTPSLPTGRRPSFGTLGGLRFGRRRAPSRLRDSAAFIRLTDALGDVQDVASGVFLGDGYVATVLHSLMSGEGITGGTVQGLGRGGGTFDIEGLRAYDPETELAIFKVAGDTNQLAAQLGQLGRPGQRLTTVGIANRALELGGLAAGQPDFLVDTPYATRVTLTGATDDIATLQGEGLRPGQSGAPIYDAQGNVVAIFGGRSERGDRLGFGTPTTRLEGLLQSARALDELGAPVHALDDLEKLDLPTREEIGRGYIGRGEQFGLGQTRISARDFFAPQRRQPIATLPQRPERTRAFAEGIADLPTERLTYGLEDLSRTRRNRVERLLQRRRGRRQQQLRETGRTLPSGSAFQLLTPSRAGSIRGQQLELALEGGRGLRRTTGRDRLFRLMQWLDTDATQPEGTALGLQLGETPSGQQRFFRDVGIAPRTFGEGFLPSFSSAEIPADRSEQIFLDLVDGELGEPLQQREFTRSFEMGADIRNLIETGGLRDRVFGRAVAGGVRAAEGIGRGLGRVGEVAGVSGGVLLVDWDVVSLRKRLFRLRCLTCMRKWTTGRGTLCVAYTSHRFKSDGTQRA